MIAPRKDLPLIEMTGRKVLVFGDDSRSFLATVRSLGRHGLAVHVVPEDARSPALRSRHIAAIHRLNPVVDDGAEWVAAVENLLADGGFDLVVPCADRFLLPLDAHRARLEKLTRLAIPPRQSIDILFDKLRTREIAASLGIGLAPAVVPQPGQGPKEIFGALGAPVVVKPRRSVSPDALHRQLTVRMAATTQELTIALGDLAPSGCYVEGFFPGRGLGVSILADRGEILLAFEHHRIHQAARGGSSAYRVSAAVDPARREACSRLCAAIEFTGVAMFEFRRNDATGAWVLLEVNARPWGSLPLPVALGVDFPLAWYRLLTEGRRPETQGYRLGIHARNFELDLAFARKAAMEIPGRLGRAWFLGRWASGFAKTLTGREKLDTLTIDDPAPALAEFAALATRAGRRVSRRLPVHKTIARATLRRALAKSVREGRPPVVAFICYGNICRSAFAQRALTNCLASLSGRVTVISAGTYRTGGRESPGDAREAARRRSVDLAPHRSQPVTEELIRSASVLIAFDESNVDALRAQFGTIARPIVLLGSLLNVPEIADPYGRGPAAFDQVFGMIDQGVRVLRACIAASLRPKSPA